MLPTDRTTLVRLSGIAGIIGAILWTLGDALIIGAKADVSDYPLILDIYADRISFGGAAMMLPSSEPRLAAGALVADIGIVFYLAGCWHLLQGLRPAGGWLVWATFALLVAGNAWSPLGHAGFYYVGMVYKTILETPPEAHAVLLDLGNRFDHVLTIAWLLPIVTLGLSLSLLGITIALGRTAWPRWFAAVANPVSLVLIGTGIAWAAPEPAHIWLEGAVFNTGWLVVYVLSTWLLWNRSRTADTATSARRELGA